MNNIIAFEENFVAQNISEGMIIETVLANKGYVLYGRESSFRELDEFNRAKQVVNWISNAAVVKRLQQIGIKLIARSEKVQNGKTKISLMPGDALFVLSPLDGGSLVRMKGLDELPPGFRFRVTLYRWIKLPDSLDPESLCVKSR